MAEFKGLYHPSYEHDACGIGFVANIKGYKSHQNIADALTVLENMEHRGACGCDANSGDGAGIMIHACAWEYICLLIVNMVLESFSFPVR